MALMQAHHKIADFRIQKNLTLQALAERVGTTKSQIDKLEKGERRLTVDWLQRIAEALNLPVSSFFDTAPDVGTALPANLLHDTTLAVYEAPSFQHETLARPTTETALAAPLPVQGRGDPLTDMLVSMDRVASHIARPPALAGVSDAYAVYMVGDSMEPRYFAGDLLYVDPSRPLTKGCFILLTLFDDTALVRRLVRRNEGGTLLVQQTGRAREDCLPLASIRTAHRIIGSLEHSTSLGT
jgi:phage repressor protein C with HTH and peptisase S24 domain